MNFPKCPKCNNEMDKFNFSNFPVEMEELTLEGEDIKEEYSEEELDINLMIYKCGKCGEKLGTQKIKSV
jgi:ssDNA-binding Zn-finger/Zn-ribbon topoisomerase 1